jgi:HK97 family phage major capsid protein
MRRTIGELEAAYDAACDRLEKLNRDSDLRTVTDENTAEWQAAAADCDRLKAEIEEARAAVRARGQHQPVRHVPAADGTGIKAISISEPDRYTKRGRSFFSDVYAAQVKGDLVAQERLRQHQEYELERYEERSMTSSTFGGLIPPQYLLELYAKAPRAGRKFLDACDQKELPETGMSLIIPRLTTGTAAASQSSENTTVATQDMVETDLTIPVRTIAGYVPTSRQSLERAQYDEEIIFEDLIARVWTALDHDAIQADGTSGTVTGVLNTSGIESVPLSSWSIQNLWGSIADAQQRIATNVGGLGYEADRIVMHPRRWAAIASSLDASDRPLLLPIGSPYFNAMGTGAAGGYGPVGELFGLPVVTSANIPTNLNNGGGGAVEDAILVFASPVVHVWEPPRGVVSVAMEQIAGDQLTVHCVAYEYASFTAGRQPGAVAKIIGAGLSTPIYGERAS